MTMTPTPTSVPSQPMMRVSNVVQLVNEGDTTFDMKYGPRDRLILQPGQSYFVQEEVAWQFLGRWWTNNNDPRSRERVMEVNRLRVLYGAYEDDILWEQNRPRLAAYSADGQRITTVVDDPEGTSGTGGQTSLGREQSLEAQMQIMQQQMLAMQAQIAARDRQLADASLPEPPGDTPPVPAPSPAVPVPSVATMGGQQIPVAPPSVPVQRVMPPSTPGVTYDAQGRPQGRERPVPVVPGAAVVGVELPVHEAVAYMPPGVAQDHTAVEPDADDVPTDTPNRVPTGSTTGSTATRIPKASRPS